MSKAIQAPIKIKRFRKKTSETISEALNHIIDIVNEKKAYAVKSRDLEIYLGIRSHTAKIKLGLVLRLLSEIGLAERMNNCKPRRYMLTPRSQWTAFIEACKRRRFSCRTKRDSCRLVGICPYWRLINYVKEQYI